MASKSQESLVSGWVVHLRLKTTFKNTLKTAFKNNWKIHKSNPFSLDTSIEIQVRIDDEHRRFFLPYRDLEVDILSRRLQVLLDIPPDASFKLERLSHSSVAYVTSTAPMNRFISHCTELLEDDTSTVLWCATDKKSDPALLELLLQYGLHSDAGNPNALLRKVLFSDLRTLPFMTCVSGTFGSWLTTVQM
jgi:hypothetical protein